MARTSPHVAAPVRLDWIALALRAGLGLVLLVGGWNKLSHLIDPARDAALVALYLGPQGYINDFFAQYLFAGALGEWISPWLFLTALSSIELASGIALIAGLLVRPLALVWGLLLWTFVIAIPVVTAPGVEVAVPTYTSPALLVQARDVALSGMMFALFNLGAGSASLDARLFGSPRVRATDWNNLGLLLRLSLALPLLVGGAFAGLDHIQSFAATPWLLVSLGVLIAAGAGGVSGRAASLATALVMLWFMATRVSLDATLIANLNAFKREFALLAAAGVLAYAGGGARFSWRGAVSALRHPSPATATRA